MSQAWPREHTQVRTATCQKNFPFIIIIIIIILLLQWNASGLPSFHYKAEGKNNNV